ncbi:MAG: DUF305 domain-containing protein [Bacillota bacterium]
MKNTLFVVLLAVIVALLGLSAYTALLFNSNSASPGCCPLSANIRETDQVEPGSSRSFDMIGPGMMGSNMRDLDIRGPSTRGPGMRGPGMMGPGMMDLLQVDIRSEHDFLIHMIPHHQEAVATANYLKDNSERPEMKRFAEDIIETQNAEIVQMTDWLETWYPNEKHSVDYQPMMRNLENLEGNALDRAFLEDMIPHHMTAVMMSQQFLSQGLAEHEQVEAMARSIVDSQRDEINLMMQWLASWDNENPIAVGKNLPVLIVGGLLLFLVFIAFVVLLIVLLIPTNKRQGSVANEKREILDNRYVKGEISREKYLALRRKLE